MKSRHVGIISGMGLALFVFGFFVVSIKTNQTQKLTKESLETRIERCAEEAQAVQDQLLKSNKIPQNECSLTLSLSVKFLEKANECGNLMEVHSKTFDNTGRSKEFVKQNKALRAAMADRVKLNQLKCQTN